MKDGRGMWIWWNNYFSSFISWSVITMDFDCSNNTDHCKEIKFHLTVIKLEIEEEKLKKYKGTGRIISINT